MTTPVIGVFPYAPQVVRDYLAGYKDDDGTFVPGVLPSSVSVSTDVPAKRPVPLVTISTVSTNGGDNPALSPRRIILYCYHPAEKAAASLAETVFAHMLNARFVPGRNGRAAIRNVTVIGTPARLDDPDDFTPRFQMTLDVLLRVASNPDKPLP